MTKPLPAAPPVPLVLLSGFLGSGKTTLLQRILAEPHGENVLVVQSEFSPAMGIETIGMRLPDGTLSSDVFEVPNGCMCCTAKDNVVATIERVLNDKPSHFTRVLVETSGVADPTALMESFWLDDELEAAVKLTSVIALVDAKHFTKYLLADAAEGPSSSLDESLALLRGTTLDVADADAPAELAEIAIRQIAAATKLVLNKVDLVAEEAELLALEQVLRAINAAAPILRCCRGQIPLCEVWGDAASNAFSGADALRPLPKALKSRQPRPASSRFSQFRCLLLEASTDEGASPRAVSSAELEDFLGPVIWKSRFGRVIRCKGVFLGRSGEVLTLQGVGEVFEIRAMEDAAARSYAEGGALTNRLLLVGLNLDEASATDAFRNFFQAKL